MKSLIESDSPGTPTLEFCPTLEVWTLRDCPREVIVPITYSIQPDQRLVTYSVEGQPTLSDVEEWLDEVLRDPDFRKGFAFVGDRRAAPADTSVEYMRGITQLLQSRADRLAPCRWAIVVRVEADFAIVRIWSLGLQSTGITMEPFTLEQRATQWARGTSRF